MAERPAHRMREMLIFGVSVALACILATFAAKALESFDTSRNAEILGRLASADSATIVSTRPDYPMFGGQGIYKLSTSAGTEYGALVGSSIPGGLFAAIFTADGELLSLHDVRTAGLVPDSAPTPLSTRFIGYSAAKSLQSPLTFDPASFELLKSLAAASRAIALSRAKELKQ